jgi:hypothetical protein
MATPACGWEVDDVVRWLEDREGVFDNLSGVTRSSPFVAELTFSDAPSANALATALRSDAVPAPMRAALEELAVKGATVHLRFREVARVELTDRGPGHVAACLLDPASVSQGLHA